MLKPEYLATLPANMLEIYSQAEIDILEDMARRISTYNYWIPAAEHQAKMLREAGLMHDDILSVLTGLTNKSEAELKALMREAGAVALRSDDAVYKRAGLNPVPLGASAGLQKMLNAGYRKTRGEFKNLTRTTANTGSKQFVDALDQAYMQITMGGFDYNTAIRNTVKRLSKDGLGAITYKATGKTDSLETAVRRAVVTGVNQTALLMQEARAEDMGCDLVETSAHGGARPSHADWQGQVFSRSGNHKKYRSLREATGYGTGAGLGGWNCSHSFSPYFEGSSLTYSKEQLKAYAEETVTYDGKELTLYEAAQKQREIERDIRKWKREQGVLRGAGLPTEQASAKIKEWQSREKDFLQQTGMKKQAGRSQVGQYGKREAQITIQENKNIIKMYAKQHNDSVSMLNKTQNGGTIEANSKVFSSRVEADKLFRPWTEQSWATMTLKEREAAYLYTSGSGVFNRPLRGYDKDWNTFIGVGKVPLDNEGGGAYIANLQNLLEKCEIREDVWLFRGSDQQSLSGLLELDKKKIVPSNVEALNRKFSGKRITDEAFFSTGIATDAGFSDTINYEILAPKGTKGLYVEPFSRFGGTNSTGDWDGRQKPHTIKSEAEIILQAGTRFRVQEIKLVSGKVTVVLKVMA